MYNQANSSTIMDKLLVGYRGWFTCPGDREPNKSQDKGYQGWFACLGFGEPKDGWLQWFNGSVKDGLRPNTDIWPDVSKYELAELYEAPGLKTGSGEKCYLFSSRNQKTVDRHFEWMAHYGVDGAFLHKSVRERNVGIRRIHNEIGWSVKEAAEKTGRVFAIMYDVSGVQPWEIEGIVLDNHLFQSPSYLKEKRKPVIVLSGFRFGSTGHTLEFVRSIVTHIRLTCPDVYLIAGVTADWRTPTRYARQNQDFVNICLNCFNAISPWAVGAYHNTRGADEFAEDTINGDMELIKKWNSLGNKFDYIPVVFPGLSGHNSSDGKWNKSFNSVPRDGGNFLWRQIVNARRHGARTIYAATWDGYDDGTALMPIITSQEQLPQPVIVTHQEEVSLPVLITYPDKRKLPVHVVVAPKDQTPLNVLVTPDKNQPPLPGVILCSNGDGLPFCINTVIITRRDQLPQAVAHWKQGSLPVIIACHGQQPPHAHVQDKYLDVYLIDQDQLSLPVHARYQFLAPDASDQLPSDWYMRICGMAAKVLHGDREPSKIFPHRDLTAWSCSASGSF